MNMDDKKLEQLLQRATKPDLPQGFEERMLQRMQQSAATSGNVIPFPQRKTIAPQASVKANPWLISMPLAASLLIGLSLGFMGYGNQWVDSDDLAVADISTGFEEAEQAAEDEPA
jgi:hypothetical protein